ncbi:hypothetical protein BDZ89DRAFT_1172844 [Hymenopellis radicata]|nr:hypothetical protein BDZ89DRAFT_1172844 [Hymenopellis radicata]
MRPLVFNVRRIIGSHSGDADHLYRLHLHLGGGYPPYTVGIYKSGGGLYLQRVQSELSLTWNVDAAGGKQVNLQLYDTNGTNAATAKHPRCQWDRRLVCQMCWVCGIPVLLKVYKLRY